MRCQLLVDAFSHLSFLVLTSPLHSWSSSLFKVFKNDFCSEQNGEEHRESCSPFTFTSRGKKVGPNPHLIRQPPASHDRHLSLTNNIFFFDEKNILLSSITIVDKAFVVKRLPASELRGVLRSLSALFVDSWSTKLISPPF